MANYAYYCLHELNITPKRFMYMDECEKGFIIACIDLKLESEKKERAKMKKK